MKKTFLASLFIGFAILLSAVETEPKTVINIAGDSDYLPYEFIDANGKPSGYNIELSRIVAEKLGMTPKFYLAKWTHVLKLLDSGKADLVQGMAFSATRAKNYYFSKPHTTTSRAIFVRKDSGIKETGDILDKAVMISQDDISGEYLLKIGFSGEVYPVPTQEIALKLLDMGDYDVAITNHMTGLYTIREHSLKNIEALPNQIFERNYCYASKDAELIERVDEILTELEKSGQLNALHDKWFGSQPLSNFNFKGLFKIGLMLLSTALLLFIVFVIMFNRCRKTSAKHKLEYAKLREEYEGLQREGETWQEGFVKSPSLVSKKGYSPNNVYFISKNFINWGFEPEEIIKPDFDYFSLIFTEDKQRVSDALAEMELGDNIALTYRLMTPEGVITWVMDFVLKTSCPYRKKENYFSYMVDITEQKDREAKLYERMHGVLETSSAKSHYLARMSHEIRTPLNGLTGFLQVLMQMPATPEIREIYEIMFNSGFNLLRIVNDVLDYSRIESGKVELVPRNFNIRTLFDEMDKEFALRFKEKGIELHTLIHEGIPPVVLGDVYRLRQILLNLLQNAMRFTEKGKITLSAEVYTKSDHETRILFIVSDTGIGIDINKQHDIFDNFSQADNSIVAKYGGTGLGLAIVKRLVELMNGFVWVESEPGKGSNFFFIIAFKEYEAEGRLLDEPEYVQIQDLKKLCGSVLLVEDNELNQLMTMRQLQYWGLDAVLAINGEEAFEIYQNQDFDLVLMDIFMPQIDGFQAAKEMRKRDVDKDKHTPIIAYTASAMEETRERSFEAGMDDFIAKPVAMYDLYRMLAKHLGCE
ncbi:MAG: transporter substrate-binding domain-containing protein [Candidatus Cloacimonadaceae bacterium]|jgi:signal transduction histidine kinase/ABC-type amino acid transport substrate-binding protein/ActR/RegA family two-component response regulator